MQAARTLVLSALILGFLGCPDKTKSPAKDVGVRDRPSAPDQSSAKDQGTKRLATIDDNGTFYVVKLDYTTGATPQKMGEAYARAIRQEVPKAEGLIDSYLAEMEQLRPGLTSVLVQRAKALLPSVPERYREELKGLEILASASSTKPGDGKLSKDELLIGQLFSDVARESQCSASGVFGSRSKTGKPVIFRNNDWFVGSKSQLLQLSAVIIIKNGSKSIALVGVLGTLAGNTGLNEDGVFAGDMDAPTGAPYSAAGKRSWVFDLRTALESHTTAKDLSDYLKDPSRRYPYNYALLVADRSTVAVLENNISEGAAAGPNPRRDLRSSTSKLNTKVEWGVIDAVAAVNSFVLKGNHDNHTGKPGNTARWSSIRTQLLARGDKVTVDDMRQLGGYFTGSKPAASTKGDLYNDSTQFSLVFQPASMELAVFFRPRDGTYPTKPVFISVPLTF